LKSFSSSLPPHISFPTFYLVRRNLCVHFNNQQLKVEDRGRSSYFAYPFFFRFSHPFFFFRQLLLCVLKHPLDPAAGKDCFSVTDSASDSSSFFFCGHLFFLHAAFPAFFPATSAPVPSILDQRKGFPHPTSRSQQRLPFPLSSAHFPPFCFLCKKVNNPPNLLNAIPSSLFS